ncbi:MAG: multidrug efflux SMR transporter [Microbacteriaceae bacterium]
MGYLFLGLAIAAEVVATTFLKLTSGDTIRWWAYIIVVVGYVAAFASLSASLAHGIPLGIAYAVWAGIGVVMVAVISWLLFHESMSLAQIAGIALVLGGVALLELGGKH